MVLLDLLPGNYSKSPHVTKIQEGLNYSVEAVQTAKNDLFNQLFVNTATWGLAAWEKALGIDTDISKTYEFRRERINAKLRGIGTVTKQMIIDTAASYSNGEVEVIEDTANYSFTIKFVGTKGIPANMSDLTITIEEIKPAHLAFAFEYTYLTWNEFENYNKTWDEWDDLNLTWDEFETYKEG